MVPFFRLFLLAVFFLQSALHSANIIFDLDGVLVRKNSVAAFWEIGISNLIGFYNPFSLEKKLFDYLHSIEPRKPETPLAMRHESLLPQIICDWLLGTRTNEQILQTLSKEIKQNKSFFNSYAERNIINQIIKIMFTPDRMVKTIKHVKRGMRLIKRCYQQKDESGNRRHRIFILSNWDLESFELLVRLNPKIRKILSYCDGLVISGEVHLIKPDSAIFYYLFNQYNINPDVELTVYIDDQEVNIKAAQDLNKKQFFPLLCKNFTFSPVKKNLKELGIIQN